MFTRVIYAIGCASLLAYAHMSNAQTVQEYTAASNSTGCMAIPYSNWRERCVTHQSDVKNWCEGKGSMSCDESALRSDPFLERIRNLDRAIQERTAQKKESEARELQDKKRQAENELASARKEVQRRIEINQQCIQHRVLVQNVFDQATSRVDSERNDSSKAAIRSTLDRIKDILSSGKSGHATQINEARNREAYCRRQL